MATENIEKNEEVTEEVQTEDASVNETDKKIEELEKELAAAKEAHIRTLAEYDNYRKRSVKEKESIYSDAKASCLSELLPVLDNFDRALNVQQADAESYKKGMEMINNSFMDILKKLGVEAFGEKGEEFDPNFHNAVMSIEDDSLGENVIAEVFNKGYKLGDKVLRHAVVKVAN